jgi:hypothetical protein
MARVAYGRKVLTLSANARPDDHGQLPSAAAAGPVEIKAATGCDDAEACGGAQ